MGIELATDLTGVAWMGPGLDATHPGSIHCRFHIPDQTLDQGWVQILSY